MVITPADEARVAAAIAAAEATTSGEIVCTLSVERHRYVEWVLALAAGLGFALPLVVAMLGFGPERWAAMLGIWRADGLSDIRAVELFALMQVLVALLATLALWWSPLAQRFAPLSMRRERVHEIALKQFLARGIHLTKGRTGVLIHVSVEDHVAEVIADAEVYAKVDPEAWAEATAALLDGLKRNDAAGGFEAAIDRVGAVLAAHFPPCPDNPDEIPNRLLIV